eukprot:GEMP01012023.1.p1 GENE.GEMP01012023.1~~GEMP01012023.1.p1  ORF type:complete len:594 (+),score=111.63 GEMP01012023.1:187-1968(+)
MGRILVLLGIRAVFAGLTPTENAVELGMERMHATTLVDAHMIEMDRECDSSTNGRMCNMGPISFLDGMFPTITPELKAYYFFQHTTETRFKFHNGYPRSIPKLVLPAQTFVLFSCEKTLSSIPVKPTLPPWATLEEGAAFCSPDGSEVEFQEEVTIIRFKSAVVVDCIEGYRAPTDFPVLIMGNSRSSGSVQWDTLVSDNTIPSLFRKEPVDELYILGPALRITNLRVVYYEDVVPVRGFMWHLALDPKYEFTRKPIHVTAYEDVGFKFGMQIPTIAPMTTLLEMKNNGLRLRRDVLGLPWKTEISTREMEPTSMSNVRSMLKLCMSSNCEFYHRGLSDKDLAAELHQFAEVFGDLSMEELANAENTSDLFKDLWKSNFVVFKLLVLRFRWNKFLKSNYIPEVAMQAPNVSEDVVQGATQALAALDKFSKWSSAISHKERFLHEVGNIEVRFRVVDKQKINVSFFALVSGRERSAVYTPKLSDALLAQVLGLDAKTKEQFYKDTRPTPYQELPEFHVFLQNLFDDLLDMEDHNGLDERQREANRKEVKAAASRRQSQGSKGVVPQSFTTFSAQFCVLAVCFFILVMTFWCAYE